MHTIKDEPYDAPGGLVAPLPIEIPPGFERDEWEQLTMVIITVYNNSTHLYAQGYNCEEDEIRDTIALRGQVGSRKGRPTNLKVPYKGVLSDSARAVAQRDKAKLQDEEQEALKAAGGSDRAARYQLRKKLNASKKFQDMSPAAQETALQTAQEELDEKRYRTCKSMEWLQTTLDAIHKKWSHIYHQADLRTHSKVLENASEANDNSSDFSTSRSALRIYGRGGALDKIMRETYSDGLAKLQSNSFDSKQAKKEWQAFVAQLEPSELTMVQDKDWRRVEPESIIDAMGIDDSTMLSSDKPYYRGDASDECEEEDDDDAEIDAYYNSVEDEYETEEQWEERLGKEKGGDSGKDEMEWGSDTDFEGFSD
ncbi:hypothetical protein TUN199_10205 [Pyrenophora tritici-repentis]|nr:hypothetical protein Alg130_10215 [Pyrenophora tritici-repentis]KAI0605560.1 hypothetical protein TUN205_10192 [Pyrenophora tritici-repentis]KAI0617802.1 hypothetical protein TUN199_10205 [Pyrenophora tritici-repentis]